MPSRLRLLEPNKEFKIAKVDEFITNQGGQKILLYYFTDSLSRLKIGSFQFDVDIHKQPFKEFACLFAQVINEESTTLFPWYILYVFYGTPKMDWKFDWAQIISNEILY